MNPLLLGALALGAFLFLTSDSKASSDCLDKHMTPEEKTLAREILSAKTFKDQVQVFHPSSGGGMETLGRQAFISQLELTAIAATQNGYPLFARCLREKAGRMNAGSAG